MKFKRLLQRAAAPALVLSGLAGLAYAGESTLSSHREAPFITELPKCDGTDFYMFNSYEPGREGYVTLIADYIPFQTPYGGPNFFQMDPDALYQIHIDNDGDGKEDLTFSFRFKNTNRDLALNIGGTMVAVPLYNIGAIGPGAGDVGALNITESYTLDLVYGDQYFGRDVRLRNADTREASFRKPADFVGRKSQPDYETYARNHVFNVSLPGCDAKGRVFVGQRKDPFVANLGEIFDLVNTNPIGPVDGEKDVLADDNVTSIILEVPASFLTRGKETIIGGWTTASLPQARVLRAKPTFENPTIEEGQWIQVSRLGMPLVNEVVIGLRDKDRFNSSRPRNDAQFATYVTNPTLPALLNVLFGVTPPCLPRNDLVSVFLTGVDGLNKPGNVKAAEMLRLNTNTDPMRGGFAIVPKGMQNPLGVLGNDFQGFPNGRRPGDDVVDIALRVVAGVLYPDAGTAGGCAPGGTLPLTDGAYLDDQAFDETFPYLRTPIVTSPN